VHFALTALQDCATCELSPLLLALVVWAYRNQDVVGQMLLHGLHVKLISTLCYFRASQRFRQLHGLHLQHTYLRCTLHAKIQTRSNPRSRCNIREDEHLQIILIPVQSASFLIHEIVCVEEPLQLRRPTEGTGDVHRVLPWLSCAQMAFHLEHVIVHGFHEAPSAQRMWRIFTAAHKHCTFLVTSAHFPKGTPFVIPNLGVVVVDPVPLSHSLAASVILLMLDDNALQLCFHLVQVGLRFCNIGE
jgi:hypothetical protein